MWEEYSSYLGKGVEISKNWATAHFLTLAVCFETVLAPMGTSFSLLMCNNDCILTLKSAAAAAAKSLQSCPTLCDPMDGSPPGSHIPGILQAKTLEWVRFKSSGRQFICHLGAIWF